MDDVGAGQVVRWWVPLGILLIGSAGGAVVGAVTNVVNGSVSGEYFAIVMGWNAIEAPLLAIPQGMLEGGGLGAAFGIVVAISFTASTRLRGRSGLALRAWGVAVLVALICWVAGGACGVGDRILRAEPVSFDVSPVARGGGTGAICVGWRFDLGRIRRDDRRERCGLHLPARTMAARVSAGGWSI
jgi:hypothetical protein